MIRILLLTFLMISSGLISAEETRIMVTYDISGSMWRLSGEEMMDRAARARVNEYILSLLFNGHLSVQHERDFLLKSGPDARIYNDGDRLTYLHFGDRVYSPGFRNKVNMAREQFLGFLPDPDRPRAVFGTDKRSEIKKLFAHIYQSYETHQNEKFIWVLVSDEDEDRGSEGPPDPESERILTELEGKYTYDQIAGIIVNNHVRVKAFLIRKRGAHTKVDTVRVEVNVEETDKTVFLSDEVGNSIGKISFTLSESSWVSQGVHLDTQNRHKGDFLLDDLEMKVVQGDSMRHESLISLGGEMPPQELFITLPSHISSLDPGNTTISLIVKYRYKGESSQHPIGEVGFYLDRGYAKTLFGTIAFVLFVAGVIIIGKRIFASRDTGLGELTGVALTVILRPEENEEGHFHLDPLQSIGFAADVGCDHCLPLDISSRFLYNQNGTLELRDVESGNSIEEVHDGASLVLPRGEGGQVTVSVQVVPVSIEEDELTDEFQPTGEWSEI
jgi:hypothetical protein